MAVISSALDGKRELGTRRSGVAGKLSAAGAPTAIEDGISAVDDKSEPGPRQLPLVEGSGNDSKGSEHASGDRLKSCPVEK